jgi:hypothetical protein
MGIRANSASGFVSAEVFTAHAKKRIFRGCAKSDRRSAAYMRLGSLLSAVFQAEISHERKLDKFAPRSLQQA